MQAGLYSTAVLEQAYLNIISGRSRNPLAAIARGMLSAAQIPYRALMQARNRLYDTRPLRSIDLGRPTVSVGNITAGGTGKTPVVQWLASALGAAGQTPAVLMRGYKKAGAAISDEQVMLVNLLPDIWIEADPDRIAAARRVLVGQPKTTCFILDDGFQHRRARRNFDLVLIHAGEPFGFGHVHPRGLLREPLAGLNRATAILITHASEVGPEQLLETQQTLRQHTAAPIFHCDHVTDRIISADESETRELSDLAHLPFLLVTGIGQPQTLGASLRRFPAAYKAERFYDDHHHYTVADVDAIRASCRQSDAEIVVTTEKDWVKLEPLWLARPAMPPLYRLCLNMRFWEGEEAPLLSMLLSRMSGG